MSTWRIQLDPKKSILSWVSSQPDPRFFVSAFRNTWLTWVLFLLNMKPVHIWAVKLANPNVYGGSPQIYLLVLEAIVTIHITPYIYGRFLEWWIPQNHGCFNTKVTKDGLIWMIWGYHHFRKPPYIYKHPKSLQLLEL